MNYFACCNTFNDFSKSLQTSTFVSIIFDTFPFCDAMIVAENEKGS